MTTIGSSYLASSLSQMRSVANITSSNTTIGRALATTSSVTIDGSRTLLLKQNLSDVAEFLVKVDMTNDALDGLATRLASLEAIEQSRLNSISGSAEYNAANASFEAAQRDLTDYILNNVTAFADWKINFDDTPSQDDYFDFEAWSQDTGGAVNSRLATIEMQANDLITRFHNPSTCPICNAGDGLAAAPTTNTTTVIGPQSDASTSDVNWDALRSGSLWNLSGDQQLSYSYYSGVVPYTYAGSGPDGNVVALNATQQSDHDVVMQKWDDVVNFEFEKVYETSASNVGEIRVAYTSSGPAGSAAYAYYPNGGASGGDTWYMSSVSSNNSFSPGDYGMLTALHEVGHAIGLKHPFQTSAGTGPLLNAALDNPRYSVMTYTQNDKNLIWNITASGGSVSASASIVRPVTPMLYDVAFAQENYGAETSVRSTDTSYTFTSAPEVLQTIVDGGGTDTMDLTGITRGSIVDLTPGSFSSVGLWTIADQKAAAKAANPGFDSWFDTLYGAGYTSQLYQWDNNVAIAYSATIENAIGSSGNDQITGNSVGNEIWGMAGNDTINAGIGNDTVGFRGAFADYTLGAVAATFTVQDNTAGRDGTDTLNGVEFLKFSDGLYDATTRQKIGNASGMPSGAAASSSGQSAAAAAAASAAATAAANERAASSRPSPSNPVARSEKERATISKGRLAGITGARSTVKKLSSALSGASKKMAHVAAAISSPAASRTSSLQATNRTAASSASTSMSKANNTIAYAAAVASRPVSKPLSAPHFGAASSASMRQVFAPNRSDVLAAILRS